MFEGELNEFVVCDVGGNVADDDPGSAKHDCAGACVHGFLRGVFQYGE